MSEDKARTPHQARRRYQDRLQESLACVSRDVWAIGPPPEASDPDVRSIFTRKPVELRTNRGKKLYLRASQLFHVYRDEERGEWRCKTDQYIYHLLVLSQDRGELVEIIMWDWHPPKPAGPHIHVHAVHEEAAHLRRFHFPSGRVLFEDVLTFLIREMDVKAKKKATTTLQRVARGVKRVWSWS